MLTCLLPFTSQAIIVFLPIQIHNKTYYFLTDEDNTKKKEFEKEYLRLKEILVQQDNYCIKCRRLYKNSYVRLDSNTRHCSACYDQLSPEQKDKLNPDIDWDLFRKLNHTYRVLNRYAYKPIPSQDSLSLYKCNSTDADKIDISEISQDFSLKMGDRPEARRHASVPYSSSKINKRFIRSQSASGSNNTTDLTGSWGTPHSFDHLGKSNSTKTDTAKSYQNARSPNMTDQKGAWLTSAISCPSSKPHSTKQRSQSTSCSNQMPDQQGPRRTASIPCPSKRHSEIIEIYDDASSSPYINMTPSSVNSSSVNSFSMDSSSVSSFSMPPFSMDSLNTPPLNTPPFSMDSLKTSFSMDSSSMTLDAIRCYPTREAAMSPQEDAKHPVQSVTSSTTMLEAPNTWDISKNKLHENPENTNIEKLIKLENNSYFVITKPNQENKSYIHRYKSNDLNIQHEFKYLEPIDATHILAFEWDKQQQVLICVVFFELSIRIIQLNSNDALDSRDRFEFTELNFNYSETNIPTVKVSVVGKTYFFIIEDQKQLLLLQSLGGTISKRTSVKDQPICPSISYTTNDSLYIYYLERSSENHNIIQTKEMIVDSKALETHPFKEVTVPGEQIECSLSLSPSKDLLALSIQTKQTTTTTYLMGLDKKVVMEGISYTFEPEFKPQIDWHPTKLIFAQHTPHSFGQVTLIFLDKKRDDTGNISINPENRIEYSTKLRNINKIFILDDEESETGVRCYARTSSDKKNDCYLYCLIQKDQLEQ